MPANCHRHSISEPCLTEPPASFPPATYVQAVQRLDALAAAAPPGSEAAAAAGTALLRRLHDDSPAVVQAVLDAPSLLRLPPTAVFDGVAACFDRAMQLVSLACTPLMQVLARISSPALSSDCVARF